VWGAAGDEFLGFGMLEGSPEPVVRGALEGGRRRIEERGVARWRSCKYQCNIYMVELFQIFLKLYNRIFFDLEKTF
jgi:hypothetical protein